MWKEKSPPYMQLVHFMFAFGACITPLYAEPFIKSTPVTDNYTAVESLLISSRNCKSKLCLSLTEDFATVVVVDKY